MPHALSGTAEVAQWLCAEVSADTYVNVMGQYHPAGEVLSRGGGQPFADLGRSIAAQELRRATSQARAAGLHRFDR
jgi:putative pyruvate formate lyase activating enzyme